MQVSAFVSYGHQDASEFVRRLTKDLIVAGISPVWLDSDMIKTGQAWTTAIEAGLTQADVVLAVMTPGSLRVDSICHDEIAFARNENRRIIPVRPAGPAPKPSLLLVRLSWADFSADYDTALAKLLAALRGDDNVLVNPTPRIAGQRPLDFGLDLARHSKHGFVGRAWLFDEIDAWLAADRGRVLLVLGEPGIGKSAIAAQLARRPDCAAVHFCRYDNTPSIDPLAFVANLAACLAARVPGFGDALAGKHPEEPQPDAVTAFRQLLAEPAAAIPTPDATQLVVVDALDESLSRGRDSILALLAAHAGSLPGWLRIVATSRPETPVLRSLEQLTPYRLDADSPENRADLASYVQSHAPTELAPRIITAADGNFLCAVRILTDLADGTLAPEQVSSLSPGIGSYYDTSFRRLFPDEDTFDDLGRPFLEPLVAALAPLPTDVLEAATRLSPGEFRKTKRLLRSFLTNEHEGTAQETTGLFHKSLADWFIRGNIALGVLNTQRGATSIADTLQALPIEHRYRLEWLVPYLLQAGRGPQAREACLDPHFLSEKLEADLLQSLRHDLAATLSSTPDRTLAALERLLDQNQHLFRRLEPRGSATATLRARCLGLAQLEPYATSLTRFCPEWYLSPVGSLPDQPIPALIRTLTGHTGGVTAVAWNQTGTLLATTSSEDGTARVWDPTTGDTVHTLTGHAGGVRAVAWNPTGTLLATTSHDGTARVWDPTTGDTVHTLTGHIFGGSAVAWNPTGTLLATTSHDGTARLWDPTTGTPKSTICLDE